MISAFVTNVFVQIPLRMKLRMTAGYGCRCAIFLFIYRNFKRKTFLRKFIFLHFEEFYFFLRFLFVSSLIDFESDFCHSKKDFFLFKTAPIAAVSKINRHAHHVKKQPQSSLFSRSIIYCRSVNSSRNSFPDRLIFITAVAQTNGIFA